MLKPAIRLMAIFQMNMITRSHKGSAFSWPRSESDRTKPTNTIQRKVVANQSAMYGVSNLRIGLMIPQNNSRQSHLALQKNQGLCSSRREHDMSTPRNPCAANRVQFCS